MPWTNNIIQELHGSTAVGASISEPTIYLVYSLAQCREAVHGYLGQRGSGAADGAYAVVVQGAGAGFIGVEAGEAAVDAGVGTVKIVGEVFIAAVDNGDAVQRGNAVQGGQLGIEQHLGFIRAATGILLCKGIAGSQQSCGADRRTRGGLELAKAAAIELELDIGHLQGGDGAIADFALFAAEGQLIHRAAGHGEGVGGLDLLPSAALHDDGTDVIGIGDDGRVANGIGAVGRAVLQGQGRAAGGHELVFSQTDAVAVQVDGQVVAELVISSAARIPQHGQGDGGHALLHRCCRLAGLVELLVLIILGHAVLGHGSINSPLADGALAVIIHAGMLAMVVAVYAESATVIAMLTEHNSVIFHPGAVIQGFQAGVFAALYRLPPRRKGIPLSQQAGGVDRDVRMARNYAELAAGELRVEFIRVQDLDCTAADCGSLGVFVVEIEGEYLTAGHGNGGHIQDSDPVPIAALHDHVGDFSFKATRTDQRAEGTPVRLVCHTVGEGQGHVGVDIVASFAFRDAVPVQVQGHIVADADMPIGADAFHIPQQGQGRFPGLGVIRAARVGVGVAVVPEILGVAALGDGSLHAAAADGAGVGIIQFGMRAMVIAVPAGLAGFAVGILKDMGILIGAALDYFNIVHPADASFHNGIGRSVFAR